MADNDSKISLRLYSKPQYHSHHSFQIAPRNFRGCDFDHSLSILLYSRIRYNHLYNSAEYYSRGCASLPYPFVVDQSPK